MRWAILALLPWVALSSCSHGTETAAIPSTAAGFEAFREASAVLLHPRCLNCHARGDGPLQGDDQHPHIMSVKRASDGKGSPAMRCTNCHQSANSPLSHSPPVPTIGTCRRPLRR